MATPPRSKSRSAARRPSAKTTRKTTRTKASSAKAEPKSAAAAKAKSVKITAKKRPAAAPKSASTIKTRKSPQKKVAKTAPTRTRSAAFAVPEIDRSIAQRLLEGVLRAYLFEERINVLYRQGELFGGLYTGSGNEAVAVGAAAALEEGDVMAPSHRGIGAHFMRGETTRGMMLQLMARAEGGTKGRDNAAHQGSMERGILGMISHLACMPALACGAALAHKIRRRPAVGLGFIGEGGTSLGDFHETMNLAAVLNLPFVMIIENNQWAYSTPTSKQYRCAQLSERAAGYGIPGVTIDGTDVELVYRTVKEAVERARAGGGPTLIETVTLRLRGHSAADMAEYVPKEMVERWSKRHPVTLYKKALLKRRWITEKSYRELEERLTAEIEQAVEYAKNSPAPEPHTALDDVYAVRVEEPETPARSIEVPSEPVTYLEAIRHTLFEEMRRDERVFCIGEDIGHFGGAFKVTKGLLEEFGDSRVIDTPISESGTVGLAIGAAMSGLRPVVEMQFADFVSNAFTQLVYNAATAHYRWQQPVPLVVRLPSGGGLSAGPFHSSNPERWFFSVPGLKIVAPSTVNDARGLLKAAIRDPNPVLFLEHKYLYRRIKEQVLPEDGEVELGRARLVRSGSQATIVTYGAFVYRALEACEELSQEGYEVEVLDLRSLLPWDQHAVLESVRRTGRVLVLHESSLTGGIGGEIGACIAERAFEHLDAPVMRLAARDIPVPFAPTLEEFFLPGVRDIVSRVRSLLEY